MLEVSTGVIKSATDINVVQLVSVVYVNVYRKAYTSVLISNLFSFYTLYGWENKNFTEDTLKHFQDWWIT